MDLTYELSYLNTNRYKFINKLNVGAYVIFQQTMIVK